MDDETTTEQPVTLEQELESLRPAMPAPAPSDQAQAPATAPTPPATPEALAPEAPKAEPTLEDKLKALDDGTPPTPETPKLSPAQEQILKIIPTPEVAQQMSEMVSGYQALSGALERHDFDTFERMVTGWNPAVWDSLLEHVYQKHLGGNKESEWVGRWIAEMEGNAPMHQGMTALQRQVAQLQAKLDQREQQETSQSQQARTRAIQADYNRHLESLFDKIEFSKDDRRWVANDIKARVEADRGVLEAIYSGNIKAVNRIFKDAVTEFSKRSQTQSEAAKTMLAAQEQKKPLAATNPVVQLGSLPDDIKQVPKGQEDAWMDEQLAKLGAATKGRR